MRGVTNVEEALLTNVIDLGVEGQGEKCEGVANKSAWFRGYKRMVNPHSANSGQILDGFFQDDLNYDYISQFFLRL